MVPVPYCHNFMLVLVLFLVRDLAPELISRHNYSTRVLFFRPNVDRKCCHNTGDEQVAMRCKSQQLEGELQKSSL